MGCGTSFWGSHHYPDSAPSQPEVMRQARPVRLFALPHPRNLEGPEPRQAGPGSVTRVMG